MGVARLDVAALAVPDDILRWTVPASWSDQEAATVPVAYSVVSNTTNQQCHGMT